MATDGKLEICLSHDSNNVVDNKLHLDIKSEENQTKISEKCNLENYTEINSSDDIDSLTSHEVSPSAPTSSAVPSSEATPCTTSANDIYNNLAYSSASQMIHSQVSQSPLLNTTFPLAAVNPLLASTLSSPFLTSNIFLNPHLSSPVLDNVIRNTWILNRWNSELPSAGLHLPTPIFPEIPCSTPSVKAESMGPNNLGSFSNLEENKSTLDNTRHETFASESSKPTVGGEGRDHQLFRVKWREHTNRLCDFITTLYGDEDSSDLKLVGKAGVSVSVHRLVMASASPFLREVLKGVKTDQTAVVVLPISYAGPLEALVSLCYTGKAKITKSLVPQILKLADELDIKGLQLDEDEVNATEYKGIPLNSRNQMSPSPPTVFTFPPVPQHSPPPYSVAVGSSFQTCREKRRPLTPDLTHVNHPKRVRVGPTFMPEVQDSFPSHRNTSCLKGHSSTGPSASSFSAPNTPRDLSSNSSGRTGSISGSSVGSRVLLWKFLLQLLHDDRFSPVYIRWVDRSTGIFRIMESDMVAQLWGLARKNVNMNYEKMSRGMRTYYKRGILYHIDGTKLIYKFNTSDGEVQHYMQLFHQRTYETGTVDGMLSANTLSHLAECKTVDNNRKNIASGDSISTPNLNDSTDTNDQVSQSSLLLDSPSLVPPFTKLLNQSTPNDTTCKSGRRANSPINENITFHSNIFPTHKRNTLPFEYFNKPRSNSIPNFQTSSPYVNFMNSHKLNTAVNEANNSRKSPSLQNILDPKDS